MVGGGGGSRDPKRRETNNMKETGHPATPHPMRNFVKHYKLSVGSSLTSSSNCQYQCQCPQSSQRFSITTMSVDHCNVQRFLHSSNKQSFCIGRTNDVVADVFTSTVRTRPSFPATTLMIRPMRHRLLGKLSSTSSTRLRRGLCHFCLSFNAGMYSFNHLFQK